MRTTTVVVAPPSVYDRWMLVMSLAQVGRFAEAAGHASEAIRLAEATRYAFTIGLAYWAAGTLHLLKGEWTKARPLIEHWVGAVGSASVGIQVPTAIASFAWTLAELGDESEALSRILESKRLLESQAAKGVVLHRGWDYHPLGRACLLVGRHDEARHMADCAIKSSQYHPGFAAHAERLLGDIASHPDRFDAECGEAHYRRALALAQSRGMRPLVGHCHLGLGKLYRCTGNREQAQKHVTTAMSMYGEMGMNYTSPL